MDLFIFILIMLAVYALGILIIDYFKYRSLSSDDDINDSVVSSSKDDGYSFWSSDGVDTNRTHESSGSHASSRGNIFSSGSSTSFSTDDVYAEENYSYKSDNLADQIERESWLDDLDRDGNDESYW